jgi:putative DNA methylase
MTSYRKKLIEVALPLDAINRGCEQDKNRKTGHIRNLHKWFAPMPLPAWRALLIASVVDDPGNDLPDDAAAKERDRLFKVIEGIAPLDAFKWPAAINEARTLVQTATNGNPPTVVDPFCGGGSTIVEAQRLGFPSIASDLNPLPVVITTALCRIPQLFRGQRAVNPNAGSELAGRAVGFAGIADDVRFYARLVRDRAWESLAPSYPLGPGGEHVFAWRWAWSVPSPNPAARSALTPLVTDWTLAKSKQQSVWVTPHVSGHDVKYSISAKGRQHEPTAGGNSARCLYTNDPITFDYLRDEGKAGHLKPQMIAMVAELNGKRVFIAPDEMQSKLALDARSLDIPDVALPDKALGFRVQAYGVKRFGDLFLPRQARAIATFSDQVARVHSDILKDAQRNGMNSDARSLEDGGCGADAYADAITAVLALCVGRLAISNNVLVQWFIDPRSGGGKATPAFRMQTISMVWDFVETNPFADSVGGWCGPVVESALSAFALVSEDAFPATVYQSDARKAAEEFPEACLVATDPPYYANIGYADLSDFFYIWLRRGLRTVFPKLLATVASPKATELIAAPYRHGDQEAVANEYFRSGFRDVFRSLADRTGSAYPMSVIYAVKQQEGKGSSRLTGWEVFLEGLLEARLAVVATWPIRTTTLTRSRGLKSNALASAICVVCRPRPEGVTRTSRRDFINELRRGLQEALGQLQAASIAPVDLAQAAVGRGMAIFSMHEQVLEADGSPMSVGAALSVINQLLDAVLAEQEGDFDTDTRWAVAWFEAHGMESGPYGDADTIAVAKNTSVDRLVKDGFLIAKAGQVRLKHWNELELTWDPDTDAQCTVWEMVQYLCARLDIGGEASAAELVAQLGHRADAARELAYRLYTVCERKNRSSEALAYNALVQCWPEVTRLAREGLHTAATGTDDLFRQG